MLFYQLGREKVLNSLPFSPCQGGMCFMLERKSDPSCVGWKSKFTHFAFAEEDLNPNDLFLGIGVERQNKVLLRFIRFISEFSMAPE